jgi:hypothetical protein
VLSFTETDEVLDSVPVDAALDSDVHYSWRNQLITSSATRAVSS